MSKRNTWQIIFAIAVVIATVPLAQPCFSKQIGSVNAVEGEARVNGAGQTEFKSIKAGDPISLNDTIQTDQNSKVHIKLDDDSHNSLGELSEINLYDFERQNVAQFYGADVPSGLIRFVKKLVVTDPASSYTVTTPTAIINVEPGDKADFVIQVFSQKQTTVTVIWGKVRVKNVLEDLQTERVVGSCRRVDVEENKVPSQVMGVSSRTLKDLITKTTIPGTLSEDVPNCGESFAIRKECPRGHIWEGERCVPCRELGLIFENGRCVPPDCGECRVLWGSRCVPCRELGMVCLGGRCVHKTCPPCAIWNGRRCAPCEEFGRVCVAGRCVPRRDCPQCSFWNGRKCVPCAELGRVCIDGRCLSRPCGPCEVRRGEKCVSCESLGLKCEGGRCVRPKTPSAHREPRERIQIKPEPAKPEHPVHQKPVLPRTPPQPGPTDQEKLTPHKPRPVETAPAPKFDQTKPERAPRERMKQEIQPEPRSEMRHPDAKQEKREIK